MEVCISVCVIHTVSTLLVRNTHNNTPSLMNLGQASYVHIRNSELDVWVEVKLVVL